MYTTKEQKIQKTGLFLTLASVTSEWARQVWGGLLEPPLSILALEPNSAKKSCSPERWDQFQLIWSLFGKFFQKSPKKWAKIENPSKNG